MSLVNQSKSTGTDTLFITVPTHYNNVCDKLILDQIHIIYYKEILKLKCITITQYYCVFSMK